MLQGIHYHPDNLDHQVRAKLPGNALERYAPVPTFMTRPFAPDDVWLSLDATYPSAMQERFTLLAEKPDWVIDRQNERGVMAAECELRDSVTGYLERTYPQAFKRRGNVMQCAASGLQVNLAKADPMAACAALASEDLVLLLPAEKSLDGKDIYRVRSGALLFPNGWSLTSKFNQPEPVADTPEHADWKAAYEQSLVSARLGRSMDEIHKGGHVKQYMNHYAPRVEHFFNAMKPGAFYWRRNWSPQAHTELFNHSDQFEAPPAYTTAFWRNKGVLRIEQQTLSKLPQSGAIVFGIKTYCWNVRDVFNNPTAFEALVKANAALSPEMLAYRAHSLPTFRKALAAQERKLGRKPTEPENDFPLG